MRKTYQLNNKGNQYNKKFQTNKNDLNYAYISAYKTYKSVITCI